MAKKATATKAEQPKLKPQQVVKRIEHWRGLADSWLYQHYKDEEYDDEGEAKIAPYDRAPRFKKDMDRDARRKAIFPMVRNLYDSPPKTAADELAAWERLGRLVVKQTVLESDYCSDGKNLVKEARRLLGERVPVEVVVRFEAAPLDAGFDPDEDDGDFRLTLTRKDGTVVFRDVRPEKLCTPENYGW